MPKALHSRAQPGFTLIELLIVTAILGLVIGVIAACLGGGIRVWDKTRSVGRVEIEALVALAAIEKDLMNALSLADLPFAGTKTEATFPVLVRSAEYGAWGRSADALSPSEWRSMTANWQVARVRYFFESDRGGLVRSVALCEGPEKLGEEHSVRIAAGLRGISWEYYGPALDGSLAWNNEWTKAGGRPEMVRVNLSFNDENGSVKVGRTVTLPGVHAPRR